LNAWYRSVLCAQAQQIEVLFSSVRPLERDRILEVLYFSVLNPGGTAVVPVWRPLSRLSSGQCTRWDLRL